MSKNLAGLAVLFALALWPMLAMAQDADYEKGVAYLRAGRAADALKLLEPLAAKDPANSYLQYHMGLAYYKEGRLKQASEAFDKVQASSGGAARRDFRLGVAFSNLGIAYFREKGYADAEACFIRALALDRDDGDSLYYLGLVKLEQGDYKAALSVLGKAGALKAADYKARAAVQNAVGMVYYKQEQPGRAIEEFGKTLTIDPDNIEALYYLGVLTYKEEGYAAASPYFDRITKQGAPDGKTRDTLFTTFFNMGVDFQNRDKAGAAEEMFGRALALRPGDPDAHYYRGYNLMALERYDEAASELNEALAIEPGMSRAKAQLEVAGRFASEKALKEAREAMDRGEYGAATALFEKASKLDPASPDAKKGVQLAAEAAARDINERSGKVRGCLGRAEYLKARDGARELRHLYPDSPEAAALEKETLERLAHVVDEHMRKAREAEGRESLGEAIGDYEALLKLEPGNRAAAESLRQARSRVEAERARAGKAMEDGQLMSARKGYEKLLRYVPEDAEAQKALGEVQERIALELDRSLDAAREALDAGDYQKAANHVERALDLSPENKDALAYRKRVAAHEADVERAQQYTPPAPANEEDVRRLYLLGVEHYTKGELEEAVTAWRRVLKLDPDNEKAISSISKAEEKLKQAAEKPAQAP